MSNSPTPRLVPDRPSDAALAKAFRDAVQGTSGHMLRDAFIADVERRASEIDAAAPPAEAGEVSANADFIEECAKKLADLHYPRMGRALSDIAAEYRAAAPAAPPINREEIDSKLIGPAAPAGEGDSLLREAMATLRGTYDNRLNLERRIRQHLDGEPPAAPAGVTDERGRPMTYWGGKANQPAAPAPDTAWDFVDERGPTGKTTGYWLREGSDAARSNYDLFASNVRSALGKHYDEDAGLIVSIALLVAKFEAPRVTGGREEFAADLAELAYWRKSEAKVMDHLSQVDCRSHRERIAEIRQAALQAANGGADHG